MEAVKETPLRPVSRRAWITPTVTQIGVIARIAVAREGADGRTIEPADAPFAVRRHRVDVHYREADRA
jgi:hypothetical protein